MKYVIVITTMLAGAALALSPMLFATGHVHPDRVFHAQVVGFLVLAAAIAMGFQAIAQREQAQHSQAPSTIDGDAR